MISLPFFLFFELNLSVYRQVPANRVIFTLIQYLAQSTQDFQLKNSSLHSANFSRESIPAAYVA